MHIVTVDKRETNRNSVIMEKVCFIWTMDALIQEIHVTEVVTDAHPQISALLSKENSLDVLSGAMAFLFSSGNCVITKAILFVTDPVRGRYKNIHHSLDIWHAAKNLGKTLRWVCNHPNLFSILQTNQCPEG